MGQVSPRPTLGSNRLWFTVIPMQRLLLLRHGESTWNAEHRWQGWLDAPLTPAGLARAGRGVVGIVTHHGVLRIVATRAGVDVHTLIPNLGGFWFDVAGGALINAEPVE